MAFTTDSLRLFLAVLDSGSFSAAARQLQRVPSAVSMGIANLEAELDLQLFDRATRRAIPTPAAHALEPMARQAASQFNLLNAQALQLHQGLEKRLVLAIAAELQTGLWHLPLATLAEEYPALEIELRTASRDEAIQMLHRGTAQLALVFERPGIDEREEFLEAGSQLLLAVASPQHPAGRANATPLHEADLANMRQLIVAAGQPSGSEPRMILSRRVWLADSYTATLDLVLAGLGWAYLPEPMVRPLLDAGTLDAVRFANMASQLRLWVDIVWLRQRPLGLGARRYLELIRGAAAREPRT